MRLLEILRGRPPWPRGFLGFVLRGHARSVEIFTHMTLDERCLLYRLARSCPARPRLMEIGSYLGASACFLAAAASERNGSLVCVDTWKNDNMSEGPRETYDLFLGNTKRYAKWIVPVRSESTAATGRVDGSFDLIFVDGGHEYEAVAADVRAWLPRVRPGGWVALHDTGWAEGVRRALVEYVQPREIPGTAVVLPNLYAVRVAAATR